MAEALLDDLEVGAAGEQPGGVGVAEVMDADWDLQACFFTAGRQTVSRNQLAGMCPSVSHVRSPRGSSLPLARRSAR